MESLLKLQNEWQQRYYEQKRANARLRKELRELREMKARAIAARDAMLSRHEYNGAQVATFILGDKS